MPGPMPHLLGTEKVLSLGCLHSSGWWVPASGYSVYVMGIEIGGLLSSHSTWVGKGPTSGCECPPGIHASSLPGLWPQLAGPGQQGAQPLGP